MRALYPGALAILLISAPAFAQSATEGPLASPDASPTPKASKPPAKKKVAHKGAKTTHAKAATADDEAGGARPDAQPILHAPGGAPADPLSFGMKWNGANDDARGTRVQNYNGDAQGTGAEVGMKLHF